MNYLGHAFLSAGDPQILCGNMIGDFVKGTHALQQYPEKIRRGLMLHRHIDSFTDSHPDIARAKAVFRPAYGLYSGAFVDTITDHFLANDPSFFKDTETLSEFARDTYGMLADQSHHFPGAYQPYYESMVQHNWLLNYRSEAGLKQALNGLKRRAGRISEIDTALTLLAANKGLLQDTYHRFINDIIAFVKVELG